MARHEPTPASSETTTHSELFLSGDFASPAEVLAARTIDESKKREILESWIRDLEVERHNPHAGKLLGSVRRALATLDRQRGD